MARQRLRAEQWATLIEQWRAGGLSLPAFCERHGLSRGTIQNWVYKPALKLAVEVAEPTPAFLPVKIAEFAREPKASRHAPIEVILRQGRRIRVRRGFDPQTLRQVVAVLEG